MLLQLRLEVSLIRCAKSLASITKGTSSSLFVDVSSAIGMARM